MYGILKFDGIVRAAVCDNMLSTVVVKAGVPVPTEDEVWQE